MRLVNSIKMIFPGSLAYLTILQFNLSLQPNEIPLCILSSESSLFAFLWYLTISAGSISWCSIEDTPASVFKSHHFNFLFRRYVASEINYLFLCFMKTAMIASVLLTKKSRLLSNNLELFT